jgi:hypothetical protein
MDLFKRVAGHHSPCVGEVVLLEKSFFLLDLLLKGCHGANLKSVGVELTGSNQGLPGGPTSLCMLQTASRSGPLSGPTERH